MVSFLLVIIYICFISLGLPDAITGAAWPIMHVDLGAPISYAGVLTVVISLGTVISSLMADRVIKKFGIGLVTAVSTLLTALALLGFSFATEMWMLFLIAVPYGLGAGAIDSAMNNFVALHYSSRHMSWLHCFWGVGALIGPYIMSSYLTSGGDWHGGYRTISIVQFVLTAFLIAAIPLWKKKAANTDGEETIIYPPKPLREVVKISGVPYIMLAFFGYCGMEATAGLWASTYLVEYKEVLPVTAAKFASIFYIGVTAGRFISGFISEKLGDRNMIRLGLSLAFLGMILVLLPVSGVMLTYIGLITIGVGFAPIYPSIIHATPSNFGKENSQALVGVQMASAYVGTTVTPLAFGFILEHVSMALYPILLLAVCILVIIMTELLNNKVKQKYVEQ